MVLPRWRTGHLNHRHALVPTVHALVSRSQRGGRGHDCLLWPAFHAIVSFSKRGRCEALLKTALKSHSVYCRLRDLCDLDELIEGVPPPDVIALPCPSDVTEPPPPGDGFVGTAVTDPSCCRNCGSCDRSQLLAQLRQSEDEAEPVSAAVAVSFADASFFREEGGEQALARSFCVLDWKA